LFFPGKVLLYKILFEALHEAVHKVSVNLEVRVVDFGVASNDGHEAWKEILDVLPFREDNGTFGAIPAFDALLEDGEHKFLQSELKQK
jgi:hypothetical protein